MSWLENAGKGNTPQRKQYDREYKCQNGKNDTHRADGLASPCVFVGWVGLDDFASGCNRNDREYKSDDGKIPKVERKRED